MFELPTSININGTDYKIRNKGDFRMVLDCFSALEDVDLDREYRIYTCLIIFYECLNDLDDVVNTFNDDLQTAILEMFKFFNCGQDNSPGANINYKLVSWTQDSQLIASAINNVAKKEVRAEEYLHWWTFMGYYLSIGDSPFSMVVGIRSKIKTGKKLEKYEQEFKKENPQYFVWNSSTVQDMEFKNEIMEQWNKGG